MNRIGVVILSAVLTAWVGYGQSSTLVSAQTAPAAVDHGAFPVKVVKTLDSSKLKDGDTVELETAGIFKLPDGTLVPKGSKLTGQVTAAKARSKGDPESQLTLTFDKLNIANGRQLSIKGMVQAVSPPTGGG
jgi:predicted RecA/RadA family phage recombinase